MKQNIFTTLFQSRSFNLMFLLLIFDVIAVGLFGEQMNQHITGLLITVATILTIVIVIRILVQASGVNNYTRPMDNDDTYERDSE